MKALGLVVFGQEDFWKVHFGNLFFLPLDQLMQSIIPVWTILVEDHQGIISAVFDQIPISGSRKEVAWCFSYIIQCEIVTLRAGSVFTQGALFEQIWQRTSRWCYIPNMKALGLVVSNKKLFKSCILKTYFLTPWPTYATNWNDLNKFDRWPPLIISVKFGQNPMSGFRGENV